MRICCTSFSFDRDIKEGKMALRDFYRFCQAAGIEGVELWDLHLPKEPDQAFIHETRQELHALNLPLTTIAVNNHEFTSLDAEERRHDVVKVKRWIDVVAAFDCSVLRVLPGELKALNTHHAERYPLVRSAFEECLDYAQTRNVTLAIENCPREAKPDAVVELVKDLDTPFLRTCPDIGNLPQAGRYQAWQNLIPYAVHAHAKLFDFDQEGEETTIDYSQTMSILRKSGFKGYLSAEFEGDGDEAAGVRQGLALIHRHMNW
jgi:sugar phosphate isomerase/epimerase